MIKFLGILGGIAVCGVGAYGFAHNLDYWGAWLAVGAILILIGTVD